jgi:KUP system potassium uptake protein
MALAALGVVFGDIGTSPLYTIRECVYGEHGVAPTASNVLGVLSLIFWSLTLVIAVKYISFVTRADNRGEGGIFALLALLPDKLCRSRPGRISVVPLLVLAGASLLYGDGIITPAISVLSAVEGIEVATPALKSVVVPLTLIILVALFSIQHRGTGKVGKLFGPVTLVWFVTIGALGLAHIVRNPGVLAALSPHYAASFFLDNGSHGFRLLGSIILAVTGGEAIYADMGHFGRKPIRLAWLGVAMPGLVLAYFGQGAILLADPTRAENPFYSMVPTGVLTTFPLVVLAMAATVIASQALISGAYSLTHQAVQLGYFPRVEVRHTSSDAEGQIYIPEINWLLAVSCMGLVVVFRRSTDLAAAYGMAAAGSMTITSIVFFFVIRRAWGWSLGKSLPLLLLFLALDLPFLAANSLKISDGGWVPLAVGAGFLLMMVTWRRGRMLLGAYYSERAVPLREFLATMDDQNIARVPGSAVFMASNADGVPPVMAHHAKRIHALHEVVVLLTVQFEHVPTIDEDQVVKVEPVGKGVYRVVARCGFMQAPNVPGILADAIDYAHLPVDLNEVTYYLGRETFLGKKGGRMGQWSEILFSFLARNARPANRYFGLPPEQVVEIGAQIDL